MDKEPNGYKCLRCDADLFGQRRKWCDVGCQKGRPSTWEKPPKEKHCLRCGSILFGKRSKYCSNLCQQRAAKNVQNTMEEWLDKIKKKIWCECCHKTFSSKLSSTNKKLGYRLRFCSMTCRLDHAKTVRDERLGVRRLWLNNNKAQRLVARQIAKNNAKPKPTKPPKPVIVKNCAACGGFVPPNRLKYCSKKCSRHAYKDTTVYKAHKKAWRLKRKAMDRGATVADKFNPFQVFDRDGWKCQICGIKTPKSLRGSYKPNAPELDHIVPISKGGQHTMTNAQTSCRSCNATKSNGAPIGQMGLFTSLIGS